MCRMLIALGNFELSKLIDGVLLMAQDKNSEHELNKKNGSGSWTHDDGWGLAYLDENDRWKIEKSTTTIYKDENLKELKDIKSKLAIIHVRKKMGSETSLVNTHPFQKETKKGNFVFCHNGWIEDKIKFSSKYELDGETDSEKLFYSLLTSIRNFKKAEKSIRKNFNRYKKLTGTNIILSTNELTYIAMKKNNFQNYYQMHLGKSADCLIISSEKLSNLKNLDWEPLEQGDIIKINHKNLLIEFNKEKEEKERKKEEIIQLTTS